MQWVTKGSSSASKNDLILIWSSIFKWVWGSYLSSNCLVDHDAMQLIQLTPHQKVDHWQSFGKNCVQASLRLILDLDTKREHILYNSKKGNSSRQTLCHNCQLLSREGGWGLFNFSILSHRGTIANVLVSRHLHMFSWWLTETKATFGWSWKQVGPCSK